MSTRGWENATATDVRDRRTVQKPSKYRNVKKTVDGIVFDSTREANRYLELKTLEHAGQIANLRIQPLFLLMVHTNVLSSAPIVIGKYIADFAYDDIENCEEDVVEDVKGVKTALYKWKKKHVEAQYGIQIREVR